MPVARKVITVATINGVDEEDFGSNETGSATRTTQRVLDSNNLQDLSFLVCRWGGECRVELTINGERFDDNTVKVSGFADLFEGTSEDTGDHDGHIDFDFLVPKGQTITQSRRIDNQDEGGDFADFSMTVTNTAFEG